MSQQWKIWNCQMTVKLAKHNRNLTMYGRRDQISHSKIKQQIRPGVVCAQFSILKNEGQIWFILIGRNLKWSVMMGRALIAARGRHVEIPYCRSNEGLILIG